MPVSTEAVGAFLAPFTLYTAVLLGAAWRKPMCVYLAVATLLPGFAFASLSHIFDSVVVCRRCIHFALLNVLNLLQLTRIAGVTLTICAGCAFYAWAAELFAGVYGADSWLPLGRSPSQI